MPQTFYIEVDEEIISVIGRLRKSSSQENYFVFPKRALVLQSIINLRLFQREAQKLGKKIILVTKDENGRMLAEKAGIATEQYSEDFSRQGSHIELTTPPQPVGREETSLLMQKKETKEERIVPRADMIGSTDFYTAPSAVSLSVPKQALPIRNEAVSQTLRVRNASPERLPSLNSKRFSEQEIRKVENNPSLSAPRPVPAAPLPYLPAEPKKADRGERLKNFFSQQAPSTPPVGNMPKPAVPATPVSIVGKKAHLAFFLLGGISLLSLIGVGMLLFLPKAEIHVTPYRSVQEADFMFVGNTKGNGSEDAFSVRLIEKEQEIRFSAPTTGTSGAANQKARGSVIIYNEYGTEPQTLVATTRLETADGTLFRLTESVTVPGMTDVGGKKEPGAIEADVIADQPGEKYNIDPAAFTIPGFKGSQKFEKFSAKSTKKMIGGGSGGTDVTVVTKTDLEKAEQKAKEEAKKAFLDSLSSELPADEKIIGDGIDIVPVRAASLPIAGTAASSFDYENTFRIRAFVFSEKTLREKIESLSREERQGEASRVTDIVLSYGESIPNYTDGSIGIKTHASITLDADIDRDQLRKMLLGQGKEGIEQALEQFPGIKKIQVKFHPEWFVQSIPKSVDRVTVILEAGEER